MNRAQRTGLAIGLAAVAVVSALAFVGGRAFVRSSERLWPARVPGVRLEPARPPLAAGAVTPDNAAWFLRQITNLSWTATDGAAYAKELQRFADRGREGAPYPLLDAFVASNAAAFQLWDTAGTVTGCQFATQGSLLDDGPPTHPLLHLAKATPYRAERALARGEWSEAVRIWQGGLRASDHLGRGTVLVHALAQAAGTRTIAQHVRRSLLAAGAPADSLRLMADFLTRLDAAAEPPGEVFRWECLSIAGLADLTYERPEALLTNVDPAQAETMKEQVQLAIRMARLVGSSRARTRNHLEALFSHVIRVADSPYSPGATERELGWFLDDRRPSAYLLNDPIGFLLANAACPRADEPIAGLLRASAERRGTAAAIAIALYQREHQGQPPESLAHLVPAYLPTVPADPFAKDLAPFRYRREGPTGWRLYSIGANQIDDGGSENEIRLPIGRQSSKFPADLVFDPSTKF